MVSKKEDNKQLAGLLNMKNIKDLTNDYAQRVHSNIDSYLSK